MRSEAGALGAFFLLLGGVSLALAALLNQRTLQFLYADGRLVVSPCSTSWPPHYRRRPRRRFPHAGPHLTSPRRINFRRAVR
jgi:hypothetical protein